ncbi:hypothetical protein PAXINDRAFT_17917 [Paxillus involutus ATCC 200175]|uniref:Uncharacterized protein n=1 Tax=Paxillus involutus ATCC 200175 TaxID=664439 RepID=A0A0C9TMG3_PAXIN|nr:hypothetical protein PAXINDRAFT_17917 [Paxillus involutus ATCC 200175]
MGRSLGNSGSLQWKYSSCLRGVLKVEAIAGGEVKCTGLLVEWETHGRTGGREWEAIIDKELANLKASMDSLLGETEEVGALLDRKLVYPESKWCSWCYTEAHRELI